MKYIFKNVKYKGGEIHQRLPLHGASGRLAESSHVLNERDNQVAAVSINTSQQIFFHMSKHIPIHRHRHRHPKISSFVSFVTPGHLLLHPSSLMSTHQETSGSSFTQLRFLTATKN